MKKKIMLSVLIILFVAAASLGATMAWFTDSFELTNTLQAGTLSIYAEDFWEYNEAGHWENVNPGDCEDKIIRVRNDGTKKMYFRLLHSGNWTVPSGGLTPDLDDSIVTIAIVDPDDNWTEYAPGVWYYNGMLDVMEESDYFEFKVRVCFPGDIEDVIYNDYQGRTYNINFTFEAIQATHTASFDVWGAGYYEFEESKEGWYEVDENAGEYTMVVDTDTKTWDETPNRVANYFGWHPGGFSTQ